MPAFPGGAGTLRRHHHRLPTVDPDGVTDGEAAAATGLDGAIDRDVSALDALLGLTAGEGHPLPFEELIKANRLGSVAFGAGTW